MDILTPNACEVGNSSLPSSESQNVPASPRQTLPEQPPHRGFVPLAPESLREAQLGDSQVETLALKFLLAVGAATGRQISEQLALPFRLVQGVLQRLKKELLVVFRNDAPLDDYVYELTAVGTERAQRYHQQCPYFGAAPVSLDAYIASVEAQSVRQQEPKIGDLRRALRDLVLGEEMLYRIGEAVNAGLGFFLSGDPGNGKTSIAERVTRAYGETIWIPRAVSACGEIVRLFDPSHHKPAPLPSERYERRDRAIDGRWVRIRRPTVVVGGELTLDQLEVTKNHLTGAIEAPLQMKSNCGVLVIDDFGRQRVTPAELLNRWIVPLEKRCDFLSLPSGRKFQVPFDQLVVFSTNLEPHDLVDEAFLRRIPYKLHLADPTEPQFREVFRREAEQLGIEHDDQVVDYLLDKHYRAAGRRLRFCHCRDLLEQVSNACRFRNLKLTATNEAIDAAVRNYFTVVWEGSRSA
jgi:predicted ATPase with chaperone activity